MLCRLGFAQQLYAQYMVTILYAPSLPPLQNTALHITNVVFGGLHGLKRCVDAMQLDADIGKSVHYVTYCVKFLNYLGKL